MTCGVAITGMGMVSPLGSQPGEVLSRILAGERAAASPSFDASPFDCRVCAPVRSFDAEQCFPDNKTLRLMNRDAQMAVVAAHLAIRNSGIVVGETYPSAHIALYGSTGLTGLPVDEIRRLVQLSAAADGSLDLHQLGEVALRRVRPVLSFKILANIPICFVSIFEGIRGENGVYTPWENHGAQAIVAGIRAIQHGRTSCAVVGGCDVKIHEFAFIALQQHGYFESWRRDGGGIVPGEGAAFLVLENEADARRRGARIYARICAYGLVTKRRGQELADTFGAAISRVNCGTGFGLVASGNGDVPLRMAEESSIHAVGLEPRDTVRPKLALGSLFAAAPAVQVCLAAEWLQHTPGLKHALATCFSRASGQAVFLLEAA
jgi:3-oxoacyl-[acyl-carrier-protein] synthase II